MTKHPITLQDIAWASDITYIRIKHDFVYLVAVMDIYSRYIVSWQISNTLETDFCCEALKEALSRGNPEYFNTDQGAQFTSREFTSILQEKKIKISMDGKGRVIDNIFIERFWRTLKYEEVYTKCYETISECRASIGEFIRKYNQERLHQSLGEYDTPLEAYRQMQMLRHVMCLLNREIINTSFLISPLLNFKSIKISPLLILI